MNGLESILLKIEKDAETECDKVLSSARENGERYRKNALDSANEKAQKIRAAAEKKAQIIRESAVSGSEALVRNSILAAKAEVVNEFLAYAEEEIGSMPDDEYFAFVKKLALKHAFCGTFEILFNSKDLKRLPSSFEKELNLKLNGNRAVVSEIPCEEIESGFIIRCGKVEQNCTFKALIEEKANEIKDALFKGSVK